MATKKIITEDSPAEQGQRAAKQDDAIRDALKRGDKATARDIIARANDNGRNLKLSDFMKESADPFVAAIADALAKKPEGLLTEMAFTRQHYVAIAEILKRAAKEYSSSEGPYAVEQIARDLADLFKRDNPSFDRQRFLSACGF